MQTLLARLAGAQEDCGRLRTEGPQDPPAGLETLARVRSTIRAIETEVAALPALARQYEGVASDLQATLKKIGEELHDSSGIHADKQALFQGLEGRAEQYSALRATDLAAAVRAATIARDEARSFLKDRIAVREEHHYRTRTLPLMIGGAVLGLAFVVIGILRFLHLRRRRVTRQRLDAFGANVVTLLDKLDALKRRHELLPFSDKDFSAPMSGATLELYDSVGTTYVSLRQEWLGLMETRQRCEGMLATANPLGTKAVEEVLKILEGPAGSAEANERHALCVRDVESLETAHENATETLESVEAELSACRDALDRVAAFALPRAPYEGHVEHCEGEMEDARASLSGDPLGARHVLEGVLVRAGEIGDWIESILEERERCTALASRLEELASRAETERSRGLLLRESGGDPDPLIERARDHYAGARRALTSGDVDTTRERLEALESATEEGMAVIREQLEAREFCRADLAQRRNETARMRERLAEVRPLEAELVASFAEESWTGVARNVAESEKQLGEFEVLTEEADALIVDTIQRFLQARGLLVEVAGGQERVGLLLDAVEHRLRELQQLAESARRRREALQERAGEAEHYCTTHHSIVGPDVDSSLESSRVLRVECDGLLAAEKPHWPEIWACLEQIEEALEFATSQAHLDLREHTQLVAKVAALQSRGEEVRQLLASSSADRARANRCYEETRDGLTRLVSEAESPKSDWGLLLGSAENLGREFDRSESLAREDMRLSRQARDTVEDAFREQRAASSFLRSGVSADVSAVGGLIDRARHALSSSAYEEVIQFAERATRAARVAREAADAEARRVERRRREERRRAAARRRRRSMSSGFSRSSSPFSGSSSSSFSSGSSSSSFSSGTSQSSW